MRSLCHDRRSEPWHDLVDLHRMSDKIKQCPSHVWRYTQRYKGCHRTGKIWERETVLLQLEECTVHRVDYKERREEREGKLRRTDHSFIFLSLCFRIESATVCSFYFCPGFRSVSTIRFVAVIAQDDWRAGRHSASHAYYSEGFVSFFSNFLLYFSLIHVKTLTFPAGLAENICNYVRNWGWLVLRPTSFSATYCTCSAWSKRFECRKKMSFWRCQICRKALKPRQLSIPSWWRNTAAHSGSNVLSADNAWLLSLLCSVSGRKEPVDRDSSSWHSLTYRLWSQNLDLVCKNWTWSVRLRFGYLRHPLRLQILLRRPLRHRHGRSAHHQGDIHFAIRQFRRSQGTRHRVG